MIIKLQRIINTHEKNPSIVFRLIKEKIFFLHKIEYKYLCKSENVLV